MKASNELKQFLQAWLDWAEAGGVGGEFERNKGLCSNSFGFGVSRELSELFSYELCPFGGAEYQRRGMYGGTQHQDPNRLAWVRAALNDTLDTWELKR